MADNDEEKTLWFTNPWPAVRSFFVTMFDSVWSNFLTFWPKAVKQGIDELTTYSIEQNPEAWNGLINHAVKLGQIPEEEAEELKKLREIGFPYNLLVYLAVLIKVIGAAVDVPSEGAENKLRHALNSKYRPNLPDYRDIIQAAFVAPEKTGDVRDVCKKMGLRDEDIDLLFLSLYRLYPEEQIRTCYLRGVIDESEMFMRMRELGYTDTRTKEIIQTWEILPGPSDLFWMVGKEAFEPESYEMMGLKDEFPSEQVEWLKKQGISSDWAMKYWIAHWEQPSIQQGFEMLHRGVIEWPELNMLFKTVEIPPYWRDKLAQIAYQPYTRVDVRRMHEMGVIKDWELKKAYTDIGYDDEHADNMVKFTIAYNQGNDRDLTKSQIVKSYLNNLITRSDAIELLQAIDYPEAQAEYVITYEEYNRDLEYHESIIKNIGDRYRLNLIEEYDARKELGKLNLPGERIEILIDTWKIDKYEDMKIPSKTDLDKFYRNKIIDADTYYSEYRRLGYSAEYANWYKKLVDQKKAG